MTSKQARANADVVSYASVINYMTEDVNSFYCDYSDLSGYGTYTLHGGKARTTV